MKYGQNRNEPFESVFNYSTDGIVVFDLEAKILDVNPAFEKMTGWSKQDLIDERHPLTPIRELEYLINVFKRIFKAFVPTINGYWNEIYIDYGRRIRPH